MTLTKIIKNDFGDYTKKAYAYLLARNEVREKEGNDAVYYFESESEFHANKTTFIASNGLEIRDFDLTGKEDLEDITAWWNGNNGKHFDSRKLLGSPEDYVTIYDDYSSLKEFISEKVDKGEFGTGSDGRGDYLDFVNMADYVVWLHQNNSNLVFRENIEIAVYELLVEEFGKEFDSYESVFTEALETATERFETGYHKGDISKLFCDQDINTTRWRYGIDKPKTPEEIAFREWYDRELIPTIAVNLDRRGEETTHFTKTSDEFKEAFKARYLRRWADEIAIKELSPQFNRLIGLLHITSKIGENNEKFSEYATLLKEKIDSGYMKDLPTLENVDRLRNNVYTSMLSAFGAVQQNSPGEVETLRKFWLNGIENEEDVDCKRVYAYMDGYLSTGNFGQERKQLVPNLLMSFNNRFEKFVEDKSKLDRYLSSIADKCYNNICVFGQYNFDEETGNLDFHLNAEFGGKVPAVKVDRFNAKVGFEELPARYCL